MKLYETYTPFVFLLKKCWQNKLEGSFSKGKYDSCFVSPSHINKKSIVSSKRKIHASSISVLMRKGNIYIYVCMYICKWTKLRVTENWCVLFNSLTYIYIYIAKWPSVLPINKSIKQVTWATEPLTLKQNTDQKGEQRTAKQPRLQTNHQTNPSWKAEKCCKYIPLQSYLKEPSWEFGFNHVRSSFRVIKY